MDQEIEQEYGEIYPMILRMAEVSKLLREKRKARGAIDFDFPESKIILDEKGKPVEIKPYERNDATRMIEDFMLAANETVAEDFFWQEIPFVYRVHESPDEEKIKRLGVLIQNFGYNPIVGYILACRHFPFGFQMHLGKLILYHRSGYLCTPRRHMCSPGHHQMHISINSGTRIPPR